MEVLDVKKRLAKKKMKCQAQCAAENTMELKAAAEHVTAADAAAAEEKAAAEHAAAADAAAADVAAAEEAPKATTAAVKKDAVSEGEAQAKTKAVCAPKKKAPAKNSRPVNIFYEFSSHSVEQQEIIDKIKGWWKEQGYLLKDLKELAVYLKVEENRAYYVINDSVKGSVAVG